MSYHPYRAAAGLVAIAADCLIFALVAAHFFPSVLGPYVEALLFLLAVLVGGFLAIRASTGPTRRRLLALALVWTAVPFGLHWWLRGPSAVPVLVVGASALVLFLLLKVDGNGAYGGDFDCDWSSDSGSSDSGSSD